MVYLQETHLNDTEHEKLKTMGFTNVFFSSYTVCPDKGEELLFLFRATTF